MYRWHTSLHKGYTHTLQRKWNEQVVEHQKTDELFSSLYQYRFEYAHGSGVINMTKAMQCDDEKRFLCLQTGT